MDRLEMLMEEYKNHLSFHFRQDMPDTLSGLIIDDMVFINANIDPEKAYVSLAEEIGHYETSSNRNIENYQKPLNRKEEIQARRWSYKKIIPIHELHRFKETKEQVFLHQIADELNLPEEIIEKSIEIYKLEGKL